MGRYEEAPGWDKGSLTVEIALLMPIVLLAWMGVVSLCLFVHNRAWLTAAAYEAAITGSWEAICVEGDVEGRAWEKLGILMESPLAGARNVQVSVERDGDTLVVSIEGVQGFYGGLRGQFHAAGTRKLCCPVSYIRKTRRR